MEENEPQNRDRAADWQHNRYVFLLVVILAIFQDYISMSLVFFWEMYFL